MEREDKITLSKYETLNSVVQRLGQDMMNLEEKEVVARPPAQGMAAAPSVYGVPGAQVGFTPSRVELKGWGVWKDTRGTGLNENEVKALVTQIKTTMPAAQQDKIRLGSYRF